jgi:MinD superfamily P-loop ATPase
MRIVVASGKGGTGKTTVATSLSLVAEESIRFLDCDVEAPNAALFLNPALDRRKEVGILIPVIDETLCTHCGRCAEVCEFHAIAVIGRKTLVFPELCHGCGSCTFICPEKAISERLDVMGMLSGGPAGNLIDFSQGEMNVGEPMAVPILRELKKWDVSSLRAAQRRSNLPDNEEIASGKNTPRNDNETRRLLPEGRKDEEIEIRDAPPGASCPVVETMRGADFLLLVTEPTPFGLNDLKQVADIARELEIPAGVVINRDGIGDNAVDDYCAEAGLPILMRIPMERRFAEAIAVGKTLVDAAPEYRPLFRELLETINARVTA